MDSLLRVLFLTDAFFPERGGVERVCLEMAKGFARAGHEVVVVTKSVPQTPSEETIDGVRVLRYRHAARPTPLTYLTSRKASLRLARDAHADRPFDVVHGHLTLTASAPLKYFASIGVPTAFSFYGPWHAEYAVESEEIARHRSKAYRVYQRALSSAQKKMQARALRDARLRIVLSGYSRALAADLAGVEVDSFHVLPGGVDPDVFSPIPGDGEKRAELRENLNLPADAFVVVTVRRLVKRMGVPLLVRAAAMLRDAGKPVHLVIAGTGPEKEAIGRLVGELGLAESVAFTGFVPDETLPDLYRASDLFVLPTVAEENFGLVVLEAAACGLPVIGTPVGSIPEVLGRLNPVFVCDAATEEAIATKIRWVRDNRDQVSWRFRGDFASRVRAGFSWNHLADRLTTLYREELLA